MKEAPLVTVYITNFNYGSYIEDAIESVLNQSFKDIELIIIDDALNIIKYVLAITSRLLTFQ